MGADAVGFNFYPQSSRYVSPEAARTIVAQLPPSLVKVGVFVNEPPASIAETCRLAEIDCVQLHGDEPAAMLAELPRSISVIRAFRFGADDIAAVVDYLNECTGHWFLPDAVLIDAHVAGAYGGTGRTINWRELAAQKHLLGTVPLILAGGLTPENVASAIDVVQPYGVDTASGVELSPGVKDRGKVRRFVAAARNALECPPS